jgi:hypothetical protein
MTNQPSADQFSEEETVVRRDEVIRRMLATPPQPHVAKVRPQKGKESTGADHQSSDPAVSPRP